MSCPCRGIMSYKIKCKIRIADWQGKKEYVRSNNTAVNGSGQGI